MIQVILSKRIKTFHVHSNTTVYHNRMTAPAQWDNSVWAGSVMQ